MMMTDTSGSLSATRRAWNSSPRSVLRKAVHLLRAVQGDPGQGRVDFVEDVLVVERLLVVRVVSRHRPCLARPRDARHQMACAAAPWNIRASRSISFQNTVTVSSMISRTGLIDPMSEADSPEGFRARGSGAV